MPMKKHLSDALKRIGITYENFYSEVAGFRPDYPMEPAPAWGLALYKDGRVLCVISHTSRGHGGDGKWYIRKLGQFKNGPEVSYGYQTQREAIAHFVQQFYHISDEELAEHSAQRRRARMRVAGGTGSSGHPAPLVH